MFVLNIVNSIIGKKGNIGLRTSYVIDKLRDKRIDHFSLSRGALPIYRIKNKNMGFWGEIPRILNAYRIYINAGFNNRKLDIKIFDKFISSNFCQTDDESRICHIWESSPDIIKLYKDNGFITILDVPIAPTKYAITTFEHYNENIKIDYSFNIEQEKKSFDIVDYIISPSDFVTDILVSINVDKNKIFTVPFGVDTYTQKLRSFQKDYKKDGIDFCFAGSINKRKGVEVLLNVWKDPAFKNDRLHLCGRLYPEIEMILKEYAFDNVIVPGFVNTQEYFQKCDVYVFPSFLEGSSKSVYEAMNSGLACIVTTNSGSVIQNGGDGFVIPMANEMELKEKMLYFKEVPSEVERMGSLAQENVKEYSWEAYADNIIKIYEQVNMNEK